MLHGLRKRTSHIFGTIRTTPASPTDPEFLIASGLGCPTPLPPAAGGSDDGAAEPRPLGILPRPSTALGGPLPLPLKPRTLIKRSQTLSDLDTLCVSSDEFIAFAGFYGIEVALPTQRTQTTATMTTANTATTAMATDTAKGKGRLQKGEIVREASLSGAEREEERERGKGPGSGHSGAEQKPARRLFCCAFGL